MWELDDNESWAPKNWCFWCVVCVGKDLRIPWTARGSNQSILKETNPEYSLEAEATLFWPPDAKSWLIRKDPDAGKDWRNEEEGIIEDDMVGWHHQLNGDEFEKAPGDD